MCPYDPTDTFCARLRHRCELIRAEHRLVEHGSNHAIPDASLVRLHVRAHVIRDRILADKSLTLDDVARSEDIVHCYATRLFRLTPLAPDNVSAILGGQASARTDRAQASGWHAIAADPHRLVSLF